MKKGFNKVAGLFNQHFWKFLVGFIAIMSVGFFFLVWANDYHNGSGQKSGEQYLKDLKRAYDEDTYGGKTPEETLALFIAALKKGDIELASRYFVPEKQEEWREVFAKEKNAGGLKNIVIEAQKLELSKNDGQRAFFTITNNRNVVEVQVILALVPNGIWKILDL